MRVAADSWLCVCAVCGTKPGGGQRGNHRVPRVPDLSDGITFYNNTAPPPPPRTTAF